MRKEYDFSQALRGKHVGKRFRIVGDISSPTASLVTVPSNNTLVGTAGEYYVCAELCKRGYLALLTPKNNPLFDVIATNVDGTTSVSIQVKTRSVRNKQGWKLNKHVSAAETPGVPFVVLVNLKEKEAPDFFIYRFSEFSARVNQIFKDYMAKPKRSGELRKDPGFRWFDEIHFTEADQDRKNNWKPIVAALEANGSQVNKKRRE